MKYYRIRQIINARNNMVGRPKKDIILAFRRMLVWNYRYYSNFHEPKS